MHQTETLSAQVILV